MNWTSQSAIAQVEKLVPILGDLGSKDPFTRARQLVEVEQNWSSRESQTLWQHRFNFWDNLFSADPDTPNDQYLTISSETMRTYLRDEPFRGVFLEVDGWNLYSEDGSFIVDRAEDLVEGRIGQLDLEPVQTNPSENYDWLVTHPRDRLFQYGHQSGYQFMILALAYCHQPDGRWVRQFRKMVLALIDQCPALPDGFSDSGKGDPPESPSNVAWFHYGYVANRLHFLLATYAVLGDSPLLQEHFHAVVVRLVRAHANHLHLLGASAFRDNYLNATGKSLYLASVLLPDSAASHEWQRAMWPHLTQGIDRELLGDGCHFHRSFSYHLTFVERPLSIVCLAEKMGNTADLPVAFLDQIKKAVRAFVQVSTPLRSTPGINDDWTAATPFHRLLGLAGDVLRMPECRYLSTEGRCGSPPPYNSTLLPDAQLVVMRSDWSREANYLLFNVSPDGGHHHPCALSIQMWSGGRPLLIDPGVGHYYTGEREVSRRSWWHNGPTLGPNNLPGDLSPRILHYEESDELVYAVGSIQVDPETGDPHVQFKRHVFFIEKHSWIIYDQFENLPEDVGVWENIHFADTEVSIWKKGYGMSTKHPGRKNLAVSTAGVGWKRSEESASRWLSYGGKPEPTTLIHYHADAEFARMGFGLLLQPIEDNELWQDPDFRLHKLETGGMRLSFSLGGETRAFDIAE